MRGRATTDAQPSDDGCATTPAKRAWCQDRQVPYDVVVFGSANVDVVVQVARIPAPGETVLGTDRA
jgi:hypothetical protein